MTIYLTGLKSFNILTLETFHMDKLTKIGAIIGGIWGLISGVWYAWVTYVAAFTGYSGSIFVKTGFIIKVICLPAYMTDLIFTLLDTLNLLGFLASIFGLSFLIIWCIGIPILFGVAIGILVTAIVKKALVKKGG